MKTKLSWLLLILMIINFYKINKAIIEKDYTFIFEMIISYLILFMIWMIIEYINITNNYKK